MLFVFGKRAKQLRLNKVSELIHNSTNHQDLEQAKVSVFFQEIIDVVRGICHLVYPSLRRAVPPPVAAGSPSVSRPCTEYTHYMCLQDDENFELVPNSDFVIARTARRDNKSDYYINDRKSNFTEVTDLLKGKGIDLDNNRFLILQGEVEQISLMKPKGQTEHETGLLEYLEDIIGTDKYIPALEEGAKKLEALNEARQSMLQRVKIAERERDALESDKTAAEAYLGKERECLSAQSVLAQIFTKDSKVHL
jgi:structural maintenance of chromosome 4